MSTTSSDTETSLEPRIQVEEYEERVIEDYPPNIGEQLLRAAFDQTSTDTYVKHHQPLNGTSEPEIVEVHLEEEQLTISVNDVIGVVNLTPTSKLQINPKIGWSDILEIFLTVEEQDRSLNYHGIPIRDFLADELRIEDIFVVVAVNYLNSLEPLFRNGFLREYETRRVNAVDGRGRIDIDRSLKNHTFSDGVPKQHFVHKAIDYNTPANLLIYEAGRELRYLFQQYSNSYDHNGYYRIFSRLEETLQRLENRGITRDKNRLSEISNITLADLPRQRHYYQQALNISKTVLSSTIGEPLDHGREDLTMDYLLSMDSLFERYANLVLQDQLRNLRENPLYSGLSNTTVDKESHQLFVEVDDFTQQPDHVLRQDGDPVAVLDTKYYAKDHSPLKDTYSRSRLLAYAYQMEVDEVAFLCPLGDELRYTFRNRPGSLEVVSPETFSIESFTSCIRDYLGEILDITTDDFLQRSLSTYEISHPQISTNSLDDLIGAEDLTPSKIQSRSFRIFKYIVNRQSEQVSRFGNLLDWRSAHSSFRSYLEEEMDDSDYVVPLFIPADVELDTNRVDETAGGAELSSNHSGDERILLHCFSVDSSGEITEWDIPTPLRFNLGNH